MSPIFKKSANLAACAHNLCAAKFSLSKNHRDLIIYFFLLCKYLPFTLKNNRPVFSLSKITPPYTARQHCARSRLSKPRPLSTQSVMGYPVPMSYTNHACICDIWRVNVAPTWIRTICQCVCWQWPPTQFPGPLFALFWRYCPRHNGVLLTCSYSMYMHFVSGAGWMSVWVGGITQARTFS